MSRVDEAEVDALVVGGGAVGLACARALAVGGATVALAERHAAPGKETSTRNSGVVHAGLYYPQGSLKAELCREGRERIYAFCREHDVPFDRSGKLVVAAEASEEPGLAALAERARDNGAGAIELLSAAELSRRDPALTGVRALWSPESGVVDADVYVQRLHRAGAAAGVIACLRTAVTALDRVGDAWLARAERPGQAETIRARIVVNAAGLRADRVAALAGIDVDAIGWRIHPCKGDYFALAPGAPRPRTRLVYPMATAADLGLGIHLTVDMGGRCIAGPSAYYVEDASGYAVDEARGPLFAAAVARYLPGVRPEHLTPDYAGIRAKLAPPPGGFRDFVVEESSARGAPAMINLVGIESPGLTASLAIADRVAHMASEVLA